MFPSGGYCEIWPTGRESPPELGFPRNVRIRELEDRLLELAHAQGLRLLAERIDPAQLEVSAWDLIVIADGANSIVRDHFVRAFGRADATAYSLREQQIVDTVLGVWIRSLMSSPSSVVMTIAQQRYLLNAREGDGLLYIRLTDQEAAEVRGRVEGEYEFRPCISRTLVRSLGGRIADTRNLSAAGATRCLCPPTTRSRFSGRVFFRGCASSTSRNHQSSRSPRSHSP